MTFERYREAVRYLVEDLWHGAPRGAHEPALQSRVRALLEELGQPHEAFPIIHVGGTTGKGSTAAMTAAVLEEAGMRVGLYVSPFLQTFVERISLNGDLMGPDEFAEAIEQMKPVIEQVERRSGDLGRPTILEVLFAVGMQHFARQEVDLAVVEVGLGGRTDCTNVFEPAAVSVITNVQLDHVRQLGGTTTEIACEKAAIIKAGTIAVTGATDAPLKVLEDHCRVAGVKLWRMGHEIVAESRGCEVEVATPRRTVTVAPAMAGEHQLLNAGLAVAAVDAYGAAAGIDVRDDAVRAGIGRARQPGRLEVVQRTPTVILDGAHNPAAADVLATGLKQYEGRLLLLIGILADKDRTGILERLVPLAARTVITTVPLEERAGDASAMVTIAEKFARKGAGVELIEDPASALDRILDIADSEDTICITGSIYLIGSLRNRWFPEEQMLAERRVGYAAV